MILAHFFNGDSIKPLLSKTTTYMPTEYAFWVKQNVVLIVEMMGCTLGRICRLVTTAFLMETVFVKTTTMKKKQSAYLRSKVLHKEKV